MERRVWFDRRFELGLPAEAFPDLLERLRGTPARLAERTSGLTPQVLTSGGPGRWSIQRHAGHFADLERLWLGRLDDFQQRLERLRPADLQNRATWDAPHDTRSIADVLEDFRSLRGAMLTRLESLGEAELSVTAEHPRLGQPMTVVDLCFFVAEHDDHHLAAITALRRASGAG
jgi:uncharacterized damage-inducible protein DinB